MFYGFMLVEQDSDPDRFYPSDSYVMLYINAKDKYFPLSGIPTAVYLGKKMFHIHSVALIFLCSDSVNVSIPIRGRSLDM